MVWKYPGAAEFYGARPHPSDKRSGDRKRHDGADAPPLCHEADPGAGGQREGQPVGAGFDPSGAGEPSDDRGGCPQPGLQPADPVAENEKV